MRSPVERIFWGDDCIEFEAGSFCRKNCLWRWAQDYISMSWDDNSDFIEFLSKFRKVKEKHAKFLKWSILIINHSSAVRCLEKQKFWHFWEIGSINYQSIKSNTHAEGTFCYFSKRGHFCQCRYLNGVTRAWEDGSLLGGTTAVSVVGCS